MRRTQFEQQHRLLKPLDYRDVLLRRAEQHLNARPMEQDVMSMLQYRNRQNVNLWRRKMGLA